MKPVVFSPAARDDLLSIWLYIAQDSPGRAESFVAELEAKANDIAAWPTGFPGRDDVSEGLRAAVHGRYLIFFRELNSEVRIVRMLHSARHLRQIFEE